MEKRAVMRPIAVLLYLVEADYQKTNRTGSERPVLGRAVDALERSAGTTLLDVENPCCIANMRTNTSAALVTVALSKP